LRRLVRFLSRSFKRKARGLATFELNLKFGEIEKKAKNTKKPGFFGEKTSFFVKNSHPSNGRCDSILAETGLVNAAFFGVNQPLPVGQDL
jgi:hypothetical protein